MKFKKELVTIPIECQIFNKLVNGSPALVFYADQNSGSRNHRYNCIAYKDSVGQIFNLIRPGISLLITGYDSQVSKDGKMYHNYVVTSMAIGSGG